MYKHSETNHQRGLSVACLFLCFKIMFSTSEYYLWSLSVVDYQDSSSHSRVRQKMMKFNLLSNFKECIQKALSCRT